MLMCLAVAAFAPFVVLHAPSGAFRVSRFGHIFAMDSPDVDAELVCFFYALQCGRSFCILAVGGTVDDAPAGRVMGLLLDHNSLIAFIMYTHYNLQFVLHGISDVGRGR